MRNNPMKNNLITPISSTLLRLLGIPIFSICIWEMYKDIAVHSPVLAVFVSVYTIGILTWVYIMDEEGRRKKEEGEER